MLLQDNPDNHLVLEICLWHTDLTAAVNMLSPASGKLDLLVINTAERRYNELRRYVSEDVVPLSLAVQEHVFRDHYLAFCSVSEKLCKFVSDSGAVIAVLSAVGDAVGVQQEAYAQAIAANKSATMVCSSVLSGQ
jgi:hypothetical protein